MSRFFNLESLLVAVVLTGAGWLVAHFGFHFGAWGSVGIAAAVLAVGLLPLTVWLQDNLLPFYLSRGMTGRALDLAIQIRDAAPSQSLKAQASIDVALVHLARADFENALKNLRNTMPSKLKPLSRAVVLGNTAYCLAHLGRELETAEAHAEAARAAIPGEWTFDYFAGLVKLKRGKASEATELIRRSLTTDPDPELPLPGERHYMLATALRANGDVKGATEALALAASAKGLFGDKARSESSARPAAGPA
jgi:tetratricopeptide (TPR) repeat protein